MKSTFYKPPVPVYMPIGEYMFTVVELILILLYALFAKYGDGVNPAMIGDDSATV